MTIDIIVAVLATLLAMFLWLPLGNSCADRLVRRHYMRKFNRLALDQPATAIIAKSIADFPVKTQRKMIEALKAKIPVDDLPPEQREVLLNLRAKILLNGGIPIEALRREFPEDFE